jgi:hypothetical protein
LEDVTVRSITQIDYYEQTISRKKDGWDPYLIHVIEGDFEDGYVPQGPIQSIIFYVFIT